MPTGYKRFGARAGATLASSMLALWGSLAAHSARAQPADDTSTAPMEEVLVTGVRSSLENAQDMKRDADTFVDAISATDIGSLPDRSVLEAMQRIPGVSIERFAAANDPDHFGVEGSGAVIRGLSQTRSEFNGRDSFTANSGRGLSFQDVPPELMGSVEMYKNQTADMIEGGIGGTVNLNTRLPFDSGDRAAAISFDTTYGDMVEDWTPTISGLFTNTWDTDAGRVGFLINVAYSDLSASSHGIQTDLYEFRPTAPEPGENLASPFPGYPTALEAGFENVYVPNGSNLTIKEDDRKRNGVATALQWESPDEQLTATLQFMRSDATLAWTENAVKYQSGYYSSTQRAFPAPGTEFEFDDRGIFRSGTFTNIAAGWRAGATENRVPENVETATWGGTPVRHFGNDFQTDTRFKETRTVVDDLALNLSWRPSDTWQVDIDLQHIEAETTVDDMIVMLGTRAIQEYDIFGNGDTPSLSILSPWRVYSDDTYTNLIEDEAERAAFEEQRQAVINDPGFAPYVNQDDYLQQDTSYYWRSAMDQYERSEGESNAARVDFTKDFDDGFLSAVKFGLRTAQREQRVRSSAYNWGQLAALFGAPIYNQDASGAPIFLDGNPLTPSIRYPAGAAWLDSERAADSGLSGMAEAVDWSNFFRGDGVVSIQGGDQLLHPSGELLQDYRNLGDRLRGVANEWEPANARDVNNDGTIDNIPGSLFLPWEINRVRETNQAAYVRFDFEGDAPLRFSGNVGLRYVKIGHDVYGSTVFPNLRPEFPLPENFDRQQYDDFIEYFQGLGFVGSPDEPAAVEFSNRFNELLSQLDDPRSIGDYRNFLDADIRAFSNGANFSEDVKTSEKHWLPSFNIKFELTDDLIGRFAVAKAIALPDMGDLRAYRQIGLIGDSISSTQISGGTFDNIPAGARAIIPDSIEFRGYKAEGGNPYLKAMESNQVDLSLEWYFSDVGSLTTTVFYKDLQGFFINGGAYESFTNPVTGQTESVLSGRPRNGGEGSMEGVEFAYQQFYDMLPAPWNHVGIQLNYSFINADGAPNYDLGFNQ